MLLRTETFVPRTGQMGSVGFGPVIPLADLDAVEDFFASLTWWESMYGWKFLDDQSLTDDWPDQPSLTLDAEPPARTCCTGSTSVGGTRAAPRRRIASWEP